eukprot:INCI12155.2.p1 GENE.INCI12155.2~~INCI12155.2.p1  ORF type:complete len:828 (-),score=116.71 INCI12155.2:164-2647(-)
MAFIFGVSIHYIADEMWEGLNDQLWNGQGFVRVMAAANLNSTGTNDNDEGPANMAGDFHMSYATDQDWLHPWKREYPLEKILEVYHLYGKPNVTLKSLQTCKLIFDLGLWAEQVFGRFLFIFQSTVHDYVPFVAEHDLQLPVGGIDDMAVWATWVWERIARWIDDGAPPHPNPKVRRGALRAMLGEDYVYGRLRGHQLPLSKADDWLHAYTDQLATLQNEAVTLMLGEALQPDMFELADLANLSAGVLFTGPPQHLDIAQALLGTLVTSLVHGGVLDSDVAEYVHLVSPSTPRSAGTQADPAPTSPGHANHQSGPLPTPAASVVFDADDTSALGYQGHSLAVGDFNNDTVPDFAVGVYGWGVAGRPQIGQVKVVQSADDQSTDTNTTTSVLQGPMAHGRFGWSLAALDFNLDGVDDLCVGAPMSAWNDTLPISDDTPAMRFWGQVDCFFGRSGTGLPNLPDIADISIRTRRDLTGLGMVLRAADLDGDGHNDLLVGAPMNSNTTSPGTEPDNIQRGLVLGFLSGRTPARMPGTVISSARESADLVIEGPSNFGWFGADMHVLETVGPGSASLHRGHRMIRATNATRTLLVGSPYYRTVNGSVGRVYGFDLHGNLSSPPLAYSITGIEHAAEFGRSIAVVEGLTVGGVAGQATVAVSSPSSGGPKSGTRLNSGAVRLLSAAHLPTGLGTNVTIDELEEYAVTVVGGGHGTMMGRLGFSLCVGDVASDDGIADIILGAPFVSSDIQRLRHPEAGAIFVLDGATLPAFGTKILDVANASAAARWGLARHGRFGTAMVTIPGDSKDAVLVSAPMTSGNVSEMGGAVQMLSF